MISPTSTDSGDNSTAQTDRDVNMVKGGFRLWMRLALLFIIVVLVKALLITSVTLLMRYEGLQSNRSCETTQTEMTQLHTNLQRITDLLKNITKDSRCQLCPEQWYWYWGHCYFFSVGLERDRMWADSEDFCREHNASLAIIQDLTEMEFIVDHMLMFSEMPFLWLGLTDSQQEGVWVWQDGTPLHQHRFIQLQWDSEQRDCADLRGGGSVFASDCEVYGPWLCEKPMEPNTQPHIS